MARYKHSHDRRDSALERVCLRHPIPSRSIGWRADLSSLRSTAAGAGHAWAHRAATRARHACSERRRRRSTPRGDGRADRSLVARRAGAQPIGGRPAAGQPAAGATAGGAAATGPQHSRRDSRFGSPANRTLQRPRGQAARNRAVVSPLAAAGRRADAPAGARWQALHVVRLPAHRRGQQPSAQASRLPTWKRPAAT